MSMEKMLQGKSDKKTKTIDMGKKGAFQTHKGKLHKALGVAEDEPLSQEKLEIMMDADDPEVRAMAKSAKGMEKMKKKKAKKR